VVDMNIKKCLMTILMGALGLIIILLIVWDIGIQNTISIFFSSNIYLYLLAVFIYFLVVFILVLRWRYILSINNYPRVSLKNLFLLVMMGQLINNITPSMKGGSEPFRAYYLSKLENIPKHVSFSSVIVERLLDTIVFLVLSLFVIIYLLIKGMVYVRELIVIWILVGIITLLGLYVIMHESLPYRIVLKLTEIISRFSSRCISKNKIHDAIEKLQKNIIFLNDNKRKMTVPLLLSFGWWTLDLLRIYVLFLAINYNISFIALSSTYLISLLVGILPTLPGSLGVSDAVMIAMYSSFGIPNSVSAAGTILDRTISYGLATILGAISYYLIKRKLKKIKNNN